MIGALWTGISGLASHQTALDNESHNISNVNTVGYKASRISFADQMYQDRIGKGSKILDAEKLYVQGNLKLTGVDYDMALSGDGFFTVLNTRSSGTAETLYTRAGNFRMGDNGTLQDAAGNEVQGWSMRAIDTEKDIVSTNPNIKMFTNDYDKLLSSKVVSHSTYIETITAKATDYSASAKADSSTIFSGAGGKSKSAKISDVEELVKDYANWLQKLKEDPDGGSASSTSQVSEINFKSESEALISKDGDQIYVYINGDKISQGFVSVTTSEDLDGDGNTSADDTAGSTTFRDADNLAASRIATYKALADKISEKPGFVAYMASEAAGGNQNDVLELSESFMASTKNSDMINGIIQIKSLIPGQAFTITEVGEESGDNKLAGDYQTGTNAVQGSGVGALESSREALSRAISGNQQDVYTPADLALVSASANNNFTYSITIYDKELGKIIPVPNDNGNPPQVLDMNIDDVSSIDDFITKFNTNAAASSPIMSSYLEAVNVNGNVVIKTLNENYDVEFSGNLKSDIGAISLDVGTGIANVPAVTAVVGAPANSVIDTTSFTFATPTDFTYTFATSNGTTTTGTTINITNPADADALATALALHSDIASAVNVAGVITITPASNDQDFTTSSLDDDTATAAVAGTDTASIATVAAAAGTSTIDGSSFRFADDVDFTYDFTNGTGTGTIVVPGATSLSEIATAIAADPSIATAVVSGNNIIVTAAGITDDFTASTLTANASATSAPLDKNNDYSGRAGAGAEFIEIVNTVDQTTTKSSLQLRLDTLGISDSAFGEFSVDSTGLITMKQDGAEFAIGQVAIALFNNNRGLEPVGDNLLAKTNDSGEPIFNLNNDKTAKIEGQTLELSTADLSESLVNLMVFQRAFEANAKSITTSDQLLNTLINLKR